MMMMLFFSLLFLLLIKHCYPYSAWFRCPLAYYYFYYYHNYYYYYYYYMTITLLYLLICKTHHFLYISNWKEFILFLCQIFCLFWTNMKRKKKTMNLLSFFFPLLSELPCEIWLRETHTFLT